MKIHPLPLLWQALRAPWILCVVLMQKVTFPDTYCYSFVDKHFCTCPPQFAKVVQAFLRPGTLPKAMQSCTKTTSKEPNCWRRVPKTWLQSATDFLCTILSLCNNTVHFCDLAASALPSRWLWSANSNSERSAIARSSAFLPTWWWEQIHHQQRWMKTYRNMPVSYSSFLPSTTMSHATYTVI